MDESRIIALETVTTSGLISDSPCLIHSICGIGIADASNVYSIYDGQSAAGDAKFRLVCGSYDSDFRLYAAPLFFSKGLYVEFTTNGEEVTVQLLKVHR